MISPFNRDKDKNMFHTTLIIFIVIIPQLVEITPQERKGFNNQHILNCDLHGQGYTLDNQYQLYGRMSCHEIK